MLCKSSMSADFATTHLHAWQSRGCLFLHFNVQYTSSWCCTAPPGAQKSLSCSQEEIVPKNILMIGPTGCGKTEIARRLAKLADAPFVKVRPSASCRLTYICLMSWFFCNMKRSCCSVAVHTCLTTQLSNIAICLAHRKCTLPVAMIAAQQAVKQHTYVAKP